MLKFGKILETPLLLFFNKKGMDPSYDFYLRFCQNVIRKGEVAF